MNKKEIANTLRDYQWMVNEIARQRRFLQTAEHNMTAGWGIEATLPKPQNVNSDPVAREVIRRDRKYKWIDKLEWKVRYVQDRLPVIENEREKAVLECLLDGMSMIAISRHMGLSRGHVYRIQENIINKIIKKAE